MSDDARFASYPIARWSYPEWMDDGHIVARLQAGNVVADENDYKMSRLFLVTVAGATYQPLAALLGGVAGDYCTAAARALK